MRLKDRLTLSLPVCLDFVFELECSESLMIEHFTDLTSIETEVSVGEVNEGYYPNEDEQPWVVSLALRFKGIVT